MKVLGISCSFRKWGNTDVMVKECLLGAKEAGAEVEFIRLTDYEIKPCMGCMRCAFKGQPCPIDDGVSQVFDKLVESDALVIGVPTYILGAAGILKMLLDRSMPLMFSEKGRLLHGRPAVAIIPYGVADWEGLTAAQISIFLLALGYRIVDRIIARCQGPGEIVLNEEVMKRCAEDGKRLVLGLTDYAGEQGICPVCQNSLLEVKGLKVRCPICNIYGHIIIENGKLSVKFEDPHNHRWTPENMERHFEEGMYPSVERYLKLKDKIKKSLAKYKNL